MKFKKIDNHEDYLIYEDGTVFSGKTNIFLKQSTTKKGYKRVSFNDKSYSTIHRLVAIAFIENPHNHKEVNHINGIKTDNRMENLEWCSSSHNQKHAFLLGLKKPKHGEKSHFAKLSRIKVFYIRALLKLGILQKYIARCFGVTTMCISLINTRGTWHD